MTFARKFHFIRSCVGSVETSLVSVCVSVSSPKWKVHGGGCTVCSLLPSAQPWLLSAFSALPREATQSGAQCEPRCPTQLRGSQELNARNCRAEDPPQVPLPSASGCSVYWPLYSSVGVTTGHSPSVSKQGAVSASC